MVFKQRRISFTIGSILAFSCVQAPEYVLVDGLALFLPLQAHVQLLFLGSTQVELNSRQARLYPKVTSSVLWNSKSEHVARETTGIGSVGNRKSSRRWNGNYKHASKRLSDVTKAKKLMIDLSVTDARGEVTTKRVEKKRQETVQHVLTKAVLWKLYCDEYPNIEIELDIGDPNYLPDVVAMDDPIPTFKATDNTQLRPSDGDESLLQSAVSTPAPLFWGESGRMKVHKAIDLMRRYPDTHIVHCRWGVDIDHIATPLLDHLQMLYDTDSLGKLPQRKGGFTFCSLPLEVWQFIDEETRMIEVSKDDLQWKELEFPTEPSM